MTEVVARKGRSRRSVWLKQLHTWHWISSALCLVGMLLFAITGFTLNHASEIEAKPAVRSLTATAPEAALAPAREVGETARDEQPLPPALAQWVEQTWQLDVAGRGAEWTADEVYLALPRPGGDAWLRIGLADGAAEYERTDRGWISYLNDLHKGRHTGTAWRWFLDIFSLACLVFSVTGFFILQMHAKNRPSTWPLVGFGLLMPVLLAVLFIHG